MEKMFCGRCGNENDKSDNFCIACGYKLKGQNTGDGVDPIIKVSDKQMMIKNRYDDLREKLVALIDKGGILNVKVANGSIEYQKESKSLIITTGVLEVEDFSEKFVEKLSLIGFKEVEGSYITSSVIEEKKQILNDLTSKAKEIFELAFESQIEEPFTFERIKAPIESDKIKKSSITLLKNNDKSYTGIIFLIIICAFVMIYNKCNSGSFEHNSYQNTVFSTNDISSDEMKDHAFYFSQYFVTEKLNAPSTAKFPSSYEMCKVDINDSTYLIHGYVDIQNGFGVMIRNKYRVRLKFIGGEAEKGKNWEIVDTVELYNEN